MRENERPTLLTRRQILASGVAMAGAIPFLRQERAAAAPESRAAQLRLTAGTRTLAVNGNPARIFGLIGPNGKPGITLSPGERTRAGLALLTARGVNCLILDEPTNHLDLEAIEELETALETYEGCLIVVTHDRRFLERLAVTRTITL